MTSGYPTSATEDARPGPTSSQRVTAADGAGLPPVRRPAGHFSIVEDILLVACGRRWRWRRGVDGRCDRGRRAGCFHLGRGGLGASPWRQRPACAARRRAGLAVVVVGGTALLGAGDATGGATTLAGVCGRDGRGGPVPTAWVSPSRGSARPRASRRSYRAWRLAHQAPKRHGCDPRRRPATASQRLRSTRRGRPSPRAAGACDRCFIAR